MLDLTIKEILNESNLKVMKLQHEYEKKIKEIKLKQWVSYCLISKVIQFNIYFFNSVSIVVKRQLIIVAKIHRIVVKLVNFNIGQNIIKIV